MIEVREITKDYGSTPAVDRLSFEVSPGRVTGFLGPNGAGKSTTMRIILGLDTPDHGEATVNGRHYRRLRWPAHQIGALLDAAAVHGGRSAYQHVRCIAESNGIGRARVLEVLDNVGLSSVARQRVGGFSLGMRQRLGIAVALLGDPPILMFDEPINGLDPEGIRWIRTLLRSLAAEGRTVFVSSHIMSEMALTADQLVVIGGGRLIADVGTDEILERSSLGHVRVRTPQPAELARLLTAQGATVRTTDDGAMAVTGLDRTAVGDLAGDNDLHLHELVTESASLEQVFMELTGDDVEYEARPHPVTGV